MAKLYFRYGAMNCGKTTALIQVAYNYEQEGMHVLLFKPANDTKGDDKVVSRIGVERRVDVLLDENSHVYDYLNIDNLPDAIIVDESQFLQPYQVDELYQISKELDVPVLTYGLRNDFQMNTFPGSQRLLALADDIEELKNICSCGKKATQNLRTLNGTPVFEGESVVIDDGKSEFEYKAICGTCYLNLLDRPKIRSLIKKNSSE